MANTTTLTIDELSYKLQTKFLQDHVVVHTSNDTGWWNLLGLWGTKETWRKVKDLGGGGFGVVWLEEETATRQLRAVKRVVLLDLESKKLDFRRELQTMMMLRDHQDYFVKLLGWYDDNNFIYLAMEYIKYGDLAQYLKASRKQAKENAVDITKQLLEGLVVLHDRHICHRDLKPQNVLIVSPSPIHVKLADFGLSKCAKGTKLDTLCGTSGYKAPELLGLLPRGYNRSNEYTYAVDMWALGCLVHEILTTEVPFMRKLPNPSSDISGLGEPSLDTGSYRLFFDMDLLHGYCSGINPFPAETLRSQVKSSGLDFVKQLLVPDPRSRMCAEASLIHDWILDYDPEILLGELESLGIIRTRETVTKIIGEFMRSGHVDLSLFSSDSISPDIPDLLIRAASKGYTLISRILLGAQHGRAEDIGSRVRFEGRALKAAAQGGHLEVVTLLLSKGAYVNFPPEFGGDRTALQAAAGGGHLEVVTLLLEKGADVNFISTLNHGLTALQAAAGGGCLEVVTLLLEKGANVNSRPAHDGGRTALQAAAGSGYLEVITLLLEKGADVNSRPAHDGGRTALQAAAGCGYLEVVTLLLEKGADVNLISAPNRGLTALQAAAGGGYLEVVTLLLEKGADVNSRPAHDGGRTALQAAAGGGYLEVVTLLLEKGADVNSRPAHNGGRTALQAAAGGKHFEVTALLLGNGADINAKAARDGLTALQEAIVGGNIEVVRLLLDNGADPNRNAQESLIRPYEPMESVAKRGNSKISTLLSGDQKSSNSNLQFTITPLELAAGIGQNEIRELLLSAGAT